MKLTDGFDTCLGFTKKQWQHMTYSFELTHRPEEVKREDYDLLTDKDIKDIKRGKGK